MKRRKILGLVLVGVVLLLGYGVVWKWMICRTYCPVGKSLLLIRKTGRATSADTYAAEGDKGVQEKMLGPGRHFVNPVSYSVREVGSIKIAPGQIGLVRSNVGKALPTGRFLAGPGEKGTQKQVLTPGLWRINDHGQEVKLDRALIIKPGYVGVQTMRGGTNKGTLDKVLQAGYYNINQHERKIDTVEIGYRVWGRRTEYRVIKGKAPIVKAGSGVSFPLADGKEMYLDFTVVWGVFPEEAPRIIREYGNVDMVETKVIEPQVLSICKNIGSNLTTMEFIEGETRDRFQEDVTKALKTMGKQKGIHILIALVRGFHPAEDIKATIQARMIAEEEKGTLKIEEKTDSIAADLELAERTVAIAINDYDAETDSLVAELLAKGSKQAAKVKEEANLAVTGLMKEKANVEAESIKIGGLAEAQVSEAIKKAEATRFRLLVEAYGGAKSFNLHQFAESLPEELEIKYRYAGPGTLWTDSHDLSDIADKKILEKTNWKK